MLSALICCCALQLCFDTIKHVNTITAPAYLQVIQTCFNRAIENLSEHGHKDDADATMDTTVHGLWHTSISDDVQRGTREHVRDDAGHSSSAITDRYVDIELKERCTCKRQTINAVKPAR